MKIKELKIKGFRGFNKERILEFDDNLTLIYAPNSYGKTSISEALEWLLYGVTLKVDKSPGSKNEYKNSYRNIHFDETNNPEVGAILIKEDSVYDLNAELLAGDTFNRKLNNENVQNWPFINLDLNAPKPFILQHALKYLILSSPGDRFQGVATILGFDDLNSIQSDFVALCTKPDAKLPIEVKEFINSIEVLERKVSTIHAFKNIASELNKNLIGFDNAYQQIYFESKKVLKKDIENENILTELLQLREEKIKKVFSGEIIISEYSDDEKTAITNNQKYFFEHTQETFIKKYLELSISESIDYVFKHFEFLKLGKLLVDKDSKSCPFCDQPIDKSILDHINFKQENNEIEIKKYTQINNQKKDLISTINLVKNQLNEFHSYHKSKISNIISLKQSLGKLKEIFSHKYAEYYSIVENSILMFEQYEIELDKTHNQVILSIDNMLRSIEEYQQSKDLIKDFSNSLIEYLKIAQKLINEISNSAQSLKEANQILKHELDKIAGTENISILIELIEKREEIRKKLEIDNILSNLKKLKKDAEQFVCNKILEGVSNKLTNNVMEWYNQIITSGDPNVHFGGFDVPRTQQGELKPRNIEIKAKSYNKDLVSAVSCLSESKLNALGLCLNISIFLNGKSPFKFIIIDDPIQSWDDDHALKFIEIIKTLLNNGIQVIILSHNKMWINNVLERCRDTNGRYYEISGYDIDGPHLVEEKWAEIQNRLDYINGIINNIESDSYQLQRAEEEMRHAICDITSEIYYRKKNKRILRSKLNIRFIRKKLLECNIDNDLISRIGTAYNSIDPAHHSEETYTPNRENLRTYYNWICELRSCIQNI